METAKYRRSVATMPTAVQREQDIAIDSFLRTTDFSPNTHKAIQAAGTLVKQVRDILTIIACPVS